MSLDKSSNNIFLFIKKSRATLCIIDLIYISNSWEAFINYILNYSRIFSLLLNTLEQQGRTGVANICRYLAIDYDILCLCANYFIIKDLVASRLCCTTYSLIILCSFVTHYSITYKIHTLHL